MEFSTSNQKSIVRKMPDYMDPRSKAKTRKTLVILGSLAIVLVGLPWLFLMIPKWFLQINEPVTVSSVTGKGSLIIPTPTPAFLAEKSAVEELIRELRGEYAVYFEDLVSDKSFAVKGDVKLTAASLIKLPVMAAYYKEVEAGRVNPEGVYALREADRAGGAGAIQYQAAGTKYSYRKLVELMGQQSDNTAFTVILKLVGEAKAQSVAEEIGMQDTSIADNITTAFDVGVFFRKVYDGKIITEANRQELLKNLTDTIWEDRIPAGIPKGIKVAHKVGTELRVISDGGIVFANRPFVLVIMSQDVNEAEAKKVLPEIAERIYELRESE